MREIKFRGLRPHDNKWLYGSLITGLFINHQTKEEICNILDTTEHPDYDCMQDLDDIDTDVITKTVGQYTGLKDKSGKEIYEGDIYVLNGNKHKIIFDNGAFCITRIDRNDPVPINWASSGSDDCEPDLFSIKIEIIGNIHENPELL